MRARRKRGFSFGKWLAVFAVTVQALLPLLLAVEISLAAAGALPGVSMAAMAAMPADCPMRQGGGAPVDQHHFCPICLAAAATVAAIAPPAPALAGRTLCSVLLPRTTEITRAATALLRLYQARAPPLTA